MTDKKKLTKDQKIKRAKAITEELIALELQEKQMQDLRFNLEKARIDFRAELQTERLQLKQLSLADEPNKKKIYGQIEKIGAIEIKIEKARVDHRLAVRKILTEDQYKIFSLLQSKFHNPID